MLVSGIQQSVLVKYTCIFSDYFPLEVIMEKEMATRSSILAWRIPWTEEPSGLQSMGLQRVIHN